MKRSQRHCSPACSGWRLPRSAFAQADKPLTILESSPDLNFPFFVHMMNQMKAEAEALGNITVIE